MNKKKSYKELINSDIFKIATEEGGVMQNQVSKFINALLTDMNNNATKAAGYNPQTDMDIIMQVSLKYAQNYIKEFAKRNNIDF